jgi:eukaryotic-like serine/threonine-protein kinase
MNVEAAADDPRIGQTVDRYSVTRLLGRGGMGAVYEARHATLSRRVAIKFLLPELAARPDILRRFENEARAAGGLEHPNLIAATDFGQASDGAPFLVMEFLQGEDCAKVLYRSGRLSVARSVDIVTQACRGLSVAHAVGIVHRDLKPENLFITRAGDDSDWVKVLDFGIAKLRSLEAGAATRTGTTLGTAFYMSPEQARGAGDVDERTDVWALGVILYQLLSGRRPFEGEQFLHIIHQVLSVDPPRLAELCPELPPELVSVVEQAMQKERGVRLPSVLALIDALAPFANPANAALAATPPVAARLLGDTRPTPSTSIGGVSLGESRISGAAPPSLVPTQRRSRGVPVVGALLCAVLAIGAWAWLHQVRPPESAVNASHAASATLQPLATPLPVVSAPAVAATQLPPPFTERAAAQTMPIAESASARVPAGPSRPATAPPSRLSEQSEPRPNRPAPAAPLARRARSRASDLPAAPETAAPSPDSRAIDIEKTNPYDP